MERLTSRSRWTVLAHVDGRHSSCFSLRHLSAFDTQVLALSQVMHATILLSPRRTPLSRVWTAWYSITTNEIHVMADFAKALARSASLRQAGASQPEGPEQ